MCMCVYACICVSVLSIFLSIYLSHHPGDPVVAQWVKNLALCP